MSKAVALLSKEASPQLSRKRAYLALCSQPAAKRLGWCTKRQGKLANTWLQVYVTHLGEVLVPFVMSQSADIHTLLNSGAVLKENAGKIITFFNM